MVLAYVSAVAGIEGVARETNPLGYYKGQPGIGLEGKVHTKFIVDTYDIWQRHQSHTLAVPTLVASLCQMLINTAYESVSHRNTHSPEFEFFRHVRHASSHGGTFNFRENEPSRPAAWRSLTLDHLQKGQTNPLYGKRCFLDLLGPADPILLLWDIEQQIK
jgi:hypothetical protein